MFLYIQFLFNALIKPHECKKAMQVDKLSLQNINPLWIVLKNGQTSFKVCLAIFQHYAWKS